MTNASTWNSKIDKEAKNFQWFLLCNGVHYNEENMDAGLNIFNSTMREISSIHHVPLLDLAKIIPKSTEYFYDDCHFNIKGAQFTGKKLADFMTEQNLIQQ